MVGKYLRGKIAYSDQVKSASSAITKAVSYMATKEYKEKELRAFKKKLTKQKKSKK